ncbi:DNA gyrase inhibitor YacG [Sphingomonas sp.]|uniref:DNA gyrase inhibitor YacG n=1 Tax=Sphingomonas sp. TaxID=28214 RepID=UPI003B00E364
MSSSSARSRRRSACPVCGAFASDADAPFCSQGCRDRDLLRWLGEGYAIPGTPTDRDEES